MQLIALYKILSGNKMLQDSLLYAWFYGISTILGYLMPNPLHRYALDI